ncbi:putative ABC transporter, AAA+ ATPase domain, P-loop containing nucleoside triphosphate hydrolase [Helianthus annuus]|nr:putative ABC transporter, AAA+ ATPase domain, P-loop containing nucleoside triphosphate hydrolase [Helianthus annuus]
MDSAREREQRKQRECASQKALKYDPDAFRVVIGSRDVAYDGQDDADANVKDITVKNFSVSAGGKALLENASVEISHGKRYGLVGPTGKGKSALLKILALRKIPVPENIDVCLVGQEIVGNDRTALEAVVSANKELVKLVAEAQASKILAGLGFTKAMQTCATRSFSGRWRMRISLARALFAQPTLLLLDEVTNYLDLRGVLWLEEYLCRWKNYTLVVVSHDRDFLNTVCNGIIYFHDLKLHMYYGNFEDFENKEMNKMFEACDKQVKEKSKFAVKEAKKKSKGKAKKAVEDEEIPEASNRGRDFTVGFHFPEPTELTPPLLQLVGVSFRFRYLEREDLRISDVNIGIDMGTRVAIVGPNGSVKSTLLNLLAGGVNPTEGEVRRSQNLRIGRYSQHLVDLLTMDETPVEYLLRLHPDQEGITSRQEVVRAKLGKFGLPSNRHLTSIRSLSDGQKARVVFTSISMSNPHILLLDEPTNHLDIRSIDALADALDEFTGAVVLVSRDSKLVSRVCNVEEKSHIWVVKDGRVEEFDGSFEDYKEELLKEIRAEADD